MSTGHRMPPSPALSKDGTYLMVEERDKISGELVFNQPAGTLRRRSRCRQLRCGKPWRRPAGSELIGVLGIALYTAPANGITYYRTTFLANPCAS